VAVWNVACGWSVGRGGWAGVGMQRSELEGAQGHALAPEEGGDEGAPGHAPPRGGK